MIALLVLAGCGAVVLVTPLRPGPLVGRSNWELATALPTRADFPADWNYSVYGPLGWANVPGTPLPAATDPARPVATFSPGDCGRLPQLLEPPSLPAATVSVDREDDSVRTASVIWPDGAATGDLGDRGPAAHFVVRAVADGPALITGYLDWLQRCDAYQVSILYPQTRQRASRSVTTSIDARHAGTDDAAVTVTRIFADTGRDGTRSTYTVSYHAVRGLLLESATNMTGAAADLMPRLTTATLHRLGAL